MDMNHLDEHLAWLLAAEEHPHLKKEEGYNLALETLRTSPELKQQLDQAISFARRHPRLVGFDRLPADARNRIALSLKQACSSAYSDHAKAVRGPWTFRRQFAWAAVLALLLAGLSVVSSKIVGTQSPSPYVRPTLATASLLPDFHQFVSQTAASGIRMDHYGDQPVELVQWLRENQGLVPNLPDIIASGTGRGCALVESPLGRVSVVCVTVEGQTMQLFVACAKALRCAPSPRQLVDLGGRPALEWVENNQVYLLTPAEADAEMPEILL